MRRFVVIEHQVHSVRRRADEDDFENRVVESRRLVKGPQEVDVTREIDNQVEKLRFERDARSALPTR